MESQRIADVMRALQAGRPADAASKVRKLAVELPDSEEVISLLASCEQQLGNFSEAATALRKLVGIRPDVWQYWNNLGGVLRILGENEAAGDAYGQAIRINPNNARLRANLGVLHLNRAEYALASRCLRQAVALPDAVDSMRVWAAVAEHAKGDERAAADLLRGWERWRGLSDEALIELAWLLAERGQVDAALKLLNVLVTRTGMTLQATARKCLLLERLNRSDEAMQAIIALPPECWTHTEPEPRFEALHARGKMLLREGSAERALNDFDAALSLSTVRRGRADVLYLRARAMDLLGRPREALDTLTEAHAIAQSKQWPSDTPREGWLSWLVDRPDTDPLVRDHSAPDWEASPIFIVGFPRSGTTLLEQMLAAHPRVVSMDERPIVLETLKLVLPHCPTFPAEISGASVELRERARSEYWQRASSVIGLCEGIRIVDKNPLNMLQLPLIFWLFPNARVVHALRHPFDSILSCYFQSFVDPEVSTMSRSLATLAGSYAVFMKRLRGDIERLGVQDQVFTLRYEQLVTEQENVLESMSTFLGLEDWRALLGYRQAAQQRGYIATPSYAQVTGPLTRRSIGRWKLYREVLGPLRIMLHEVMNGYLAE